MMTEAELKKALDSVADLNDMNGSLMLIDRPDAWYEANRWRCVNDHVNEGVHKGGAEYEGVYRYDLCVECQAPVRLTFPHDASGPMKVMGPIV